MKLQISSWESDSKNIWPFSGPRCYPIRTCIRYKIQTLWRAIWWMNSVLLQGIWVLAFPISCMHTSHYSHSAYLPGWTSSTIYTLGTGNAKNNCHVSFKITPWRTKNKTWMGVPDCLSEKHVNPDPWGCEFGPHIEYFFLYMSPI